MKRRFVYVLLFAVPSLLVALVAGALAAGLAAGVFWLFVFGDSSWPAWTGGAIAATGVLVALVLWLAQLTVAFSVGRREEARPEFNRRHAAIAIGSTVALTALIVARLLNIGGGPPSDAERCADYCSARGFNASGTSPRDSGDRTCICYDSQGREATRVNLGELGGRN
jgi:hypothetical protein